MSTKDAIAAWIRCLVWPGLTMGHVQVSARTIGVSFRFHSAQRAEDFEPWVLVAFDDAQLVPPDAFVAWFPEEVTRHLAALVPCWLAWCVEQGMRAACGAETEGPLTDIALHLRGMAARERMLGYSPRGFIVGSGAWRLLVRELEQRRLVPTVVEFEPGVAGMFDGLPIVVDPAFPDLGLMAEREAKRFEAARKRAMEV